jgi:alkylation response protein AidB-like acyl-CoA dehydrogenase
MGRLCTTDDLTEVQQDILRTVRDFVDEKILPVATDLEHDDEYPVEIVEGMKQLGLFGLTIPEEYGGLGESLLTYALVVEELARGWMSVSGIVNTQLHRRLHADAARHRRAEEALPAPDGRR